MHEEIYTINNNRYYSRFLQNWISKPSNKESKNPNLNKDNITNDDINISRFIIIIIISNIVYTIYAMYMTHQILEFLFRLWDVDY